MDTVICNLRELAEKEVKKAVEKIIAQHTGTIVNCGLEECEHNRDGICTTDEISLDDEHCCNGGCDYGWKMEDEDEDEEADNEYEKCGDCIHSGDSEAMCILRQCVHAVKTKECFEPKKADRKTGKWTTEEVAELLFNLFGDDCACNFFGIDEWLPEKCKYTEIAEECPNPKEKHGCWMQFLIQGGADMRGEQNG